MNNNGKWSQTKLLLLLIYCFVVVTTIEGEQSNNDEDEHDNAFSFGRPDTRSALDESKPYSFGRRRRRSRRKWPMLETWQLELEELSSRGTQQWREPAIFTKGAAAGVPKNATQQVSSSLRNHFHSLRHSPTTLLGDFVAVLGFATIFQAFQTTLTSQRGLVRHALASVVAPPTQLAWRQIAQVVETLQNEPSLRAWTQFSPHVVWKSLQAIRKLQQALPKEQFAEGPPPPPLDESTIRGVANDLAYFSVYASLVYGWPMALSRFAYGWPKWRGGGRGKDGLQSLLEHADLAESDILLASWQADTHRPAYLLVRDPHQRAIVLTIRGTWSPSDVLTDLCCTTAELTVASTTRNDTLSALWRWLRPHRYPTLEAHHGMAQAALSLQERLYTHVEQALKANPEYRLVLVGHSMGGGCAALLGLLWENVFKPVVYVYGPPCVAPFQSPLTHHGQIHSVVLPGDPFCTLSLGHMTELAATVNYLAKHDALRRGICRRSVSSVYAVEIWSLLEENVWSKRRRSDPSQRDASADDSPCSPKLVPPGNVWRLVPQHQQKSKNKTWRLERASTREFLSLSIQPFAMDLTRHVPTLYEACLRQSFV